MRKYVFTLLIGLVLFPAGIFCQNLLHNPEHIAYDAIHQRYLVTNYGNGTIVSIDQAGTQRVVLTGLPECMGIHIQDTVLMVSFGKKIRFFDLSSLRQFREVTLNTTSWLDGMITDNQRNVYVVESGGKIFKISLDTFEATTIITTGIPQYGQDLAFDPGNNRLIVVAWAINSPIKAVDLNTNTVTTLIATQLGNFDGVVRDSLGNLLVSCHRNGGKIYRFDQSFQKAPTVVATGMQSPAGICLNDTDNVLAIPDFDGNAVTFVSGIYSGIDKFSKKPYLGQTPPGMTPEKFAPDIVSSPGLREYSLTLSSDSTEVFFYRFGQNVPSKLYFSRFENGSWTTPAEFGPSAGHPASEPCMTPDDQRLYFIWETGEAATSGYNMVERNSTGWSEPVFAGNGMYLTCSDDGQLYTTDMSALTTGRTYLAKVAANRGVFGRMTRIQVQPHYGTQAHPCIARDSSYLLFDVDGGTHLYVSFRKSDGTWATGIDLTNHGFDIKAGGAYISPDGKYLFFHQSGDIWWVDIRVIEDLNPFTGGIDKSSSPGFELYQNTPNPCQKSTKIAFSLEKPGKITLEVYSSLGTRVSRLISNQFYFPGEYQVWFDLPNLQAGIYTISLSNGSGLPLTKRMVVTK